VQQNQRIGGEFRFPNLQFLAHRLAGIDVINQQYIDRSFREIRRRFNCIGFCQLRYGGKQFRCGILSGLPRRIINGRLVRAYPSHSDTT